MSNQRRKNEIRKLREEGRKAFEDGKHSQTCPYKFCDKQQWLNGYQDAASESKNNLEDQA